MTEVAIKEDEEVKDEEEEEKRKKKKKKKKKRKRRSIYLRIVRSYELTARQTEIAAAVQILPFCACALHQQRD